MFSLLVACAVESLDQLGLPELLRQLYKFVPGVVVNEFCD